MYHYYDNVTGHVIFEMCTGREISTLTPSDSDYRDVKDRGVREVLKFIFAQEDDEFIHGLNEVKSYKLRFCDKVITIIATSKL